jgi:hypothetical protein
MAPDLNIGNAKQDLSIWQQPTTTTKKYPTWALQLISLP